MAFQPDPLLLELFEAVHKDLATALEARQRLSDHTPNKDIEIVAALAQKIAGLKGAIAALEAALECRHARVVH